MLIILLAYFGGILTIVSPCILPVLPFVFARADRSFMRSTLPMLAGGDYRAFEIVGDSMMPTPSGSVIVGERVQDLEDVKTNQTYIVVSKTDGIVYKRMMKNNRQKNKFTLVSDNPAYQPYIVNAEDIVEVWQAQMIISKANTQQRWDVGQLANMVNSLQQQVSSMKKRMN